MIRLVIADDHAIMRDGLKRLFEKEADIRVVGEAANGQEALQRVAKDAPDLLLLDISMPDGGPELITRMQADHPGLRILVLSMHNVSQLVSRSLQLGALGYVTKDSEPEELLTAVRKVGAGSRYVSPALAQSMVLGNCPDGDLTRLSSRELQILRMFVDGVSVGEIADKLFLSPKTVSSHKSRILAKLRVDNDAELIKKAIALGLTLPSL